MASKSWLQREKKKQKLEQKYHLIRRSLKNELRKEKNELRKEKNELRKDSSSIEKSKIHGKLQSSPRNSAPTRLRRRCFETGRTRANYRYFGLSGYRLREMFHAGLLPGAIRSSS